MQPSTTPKLKIANKQLLPQVLNLINEGHTVTLPLRGYSMRPFLEDGRDKALLTHTDRYRVGDVVLAEVAPGHYVLHRLIHLTAQQAVLLGDGNLKTETCTPQDLKAIAIGFYRHGTTRLDRTSDRKWKVYSWWWTRLRPVRRYLLFVWRKVFV